MAFPSESELINSIQQLKSYVQISDDDVNLVSTAALLLNVSATSSISLNSSVGSPAPSITQADIKTAIETSTNIDQLESLLSNLVTYINDLKNLQTQIRDKLNTLSVGFYSWAIVSRANNTNLYISNDVYGAKFTLTDFAPSTGDFIITSVQITFNILTLPVGMGGFLLYLYSSSPTTILDNGTFSIDTSANLLAEIPLGVARLAPGGGLVRLQADNLNLQRRAMGSTVYGYLVTQSSFTPNNVSETFKIETWQMAI